MGISNTSKGTYSDIIFSEKSNKLLDYILEYYNLKKDFKDAYHCTLIYSKKHILNYKTSKGVLQDKNGNAKSKINKLVKIKSFGHFDTEDGKNLHIELECLWCHTQFNRAIKSGGIFDYDKYVPHVTLMYNCGKDFDISRRDTTKWIGRKLEVIEERISELNEDWVEKSTK